MPYAPSNHMLQLSSHPIYTVTKTPIDHLFRDFFSLALFYFFLSIFFRLSLFASYRPTEREETEKVIRTALKEIIVQLDLDEVTSKYIRTRLEEHLDMNLTEYKSFIDEEMLKILKQLDAPTKIFDHVYLGSEWNASNLEELQKNGFVFTHQSHTI